MTVPRPSAIWYRINTRRGFLRAAAAAALATGVAPAPAQALKEEPGPPPPPPPPPPPEFPRQGGPKTFTLTGAGTVNRGATVGTNLSQANYIGLVVGRQQSSAEVQLVGLVPLGHQKRGPHQLPWDLNVDGKRLGTGVYEVLLEIFTHDGRPTGIPPTPEYAFLTITKGGHVSVHMVSLKSLL